jgi:hypothetical protein
MGMTWIAACSGQRGTYQETIMTDEERQKLVARLRAHEVVMWTDIDLAADEIERLARIVEDYKMTFGDIHEVVVMGAGITHD